MLLLLISVVIVVCSYWFNNIPAHSEKRYSVCKAKPGIVFITPETESQHYVRKDPKKLANKWLLCYAAKLMRLCPFQSMKAKKMTESLMSRGILKSS